MTKKIFKSYGMCRTHFTELAAWLSGGLAFSNATGTFKGGPVDPTSFLPLGRLAAHEAEATKFMEDNYQNGIDYVVWSYGTPIAYHVRENGKVKAHWVEPAITYSKTTTGKHQRPISTALNVVKGWA